MKLHAHEMDPGSLVKRILNSILMLPVTRLAIDAIVFLMACLLLFSIYVNRYVSSLLNLGVSGASNELLRIAAFLTQRGKLRNFLLDFMSLRTPRTGDRQLKWINRLIAFCWNCLDHILKNSRDKLQIFQDDGIDCGEIKVKIERLELGQRAPVMTGLTVYDESTLQVNPSQMILDVEIVLDSSCLMIFLFDMPVIGRIRGGIRDLRGKFLIRFILRPIDSNGLGGVCVFFLEVPKWDFEGVDAASFVNRPIVRRIINKILNDFMPVKFYIPFKAEKTRQLIYPSPFAICMFKIACKSAPKRIWCCPSFWRKKVYVYLKISERYYKVEAAPSLDNAVWHSIDINDYLDTFSILRMGTDQDKYDVQFKVGSLVKEDRFGKIIRISIHIDNEITDQLMMEILVFKLSNERNNLELVKTLPLSRFSYNFPLGFITIYFEKIEFIICTDYVKLAIFIGKNKVKLDKIFVHGSTSVKLGECIHVPYINLVENSRIKFVLVAYSKSHEFISHGKFDAGKIAQLQLMIQNFQVKFKRRNNPVVSVKGSIEVTAISKDEIVRLLSTRRII